MNRIKLQENSRMVQLPHQNKDNKHNNNQQASKIQT